MQVRKVAVVATGTLAAAAAMGSTPAFAADSAASIPEVAPSAIGILDYVGAHRASDEAMQQLAEQWLTVTPEQTWVAPWEVEPPQILSVGSNSAISTLAWQVCGSTAVDGAGIAAPIASPNTVVGDCNNANIDIVDSGRPALFSILDNTAISTAPWQVCGSTAVNGVGAAVPIASPNTVLGDCNNGNISISSENGDNGNGYNGNGNNGYYPYVPLGWGESDGAEAAGAEAAGAEAADTEQTIVPIVAPWEVEPPQILSAGSNTAVSTAAWQVCGSTTVNGVGAAIPVASPNTVVGDCNNGNIDINHVRDDALFSLASGTAASTAPFQTCGSSAVNGGGLVLPIASPNTVLGDCNNGNISLNG